MMLVTRCHQSPLVYSVRIGPSPFYLSSDLECFVFDF